MPERILMKNERGVISALETDFKGTSHLGRSFHFAESLYLHLAEYGLKRPHQDNPAVRRVVRHSMASAFIPENEVCSSISMLLQETEV